MQKSLCMATVMSEYTMTENKRKKEGDQTNISITITLNKQIQQKNIGVISINCTRKSKTYCSFRNYKNRSNRID